MEFLSPEVALYLYKSTIRPCMVYYCHVWVSAPNYYLELLGKLQKQICRTVAPSLSVSLEPVAHGQNVGCLSLFYRCYFGRCSSELAELAPILEGRLLVILIDCVIFLSQLPDVIRMSTPTVSFLAQLDSGILCLQNSFFRLMISVALSLELTSIFYLQALSKQIQSILKSFASFSCNSMSSSGYSALHVVNPNKKRLQFKYSCPLQ